MDSQRKFKVELTEKEIESICTALLYAQLREEGLWTAAHREAYGHSSRAYAYKELKSRLRVASGENAG